MLFHIRAIARHTEKPREALQARLLYWDYKETETVATDSVCWYFQSIFPSFVYIVPKLNFLYIELNIYADEDQF